METMLHGMGYYHYDQVADWSADEVEWVDGNLEGFSGRVSRDQWVPQAKILSRGGEIDEEAFAQGRIAAATAGAAVSAGASTGTGAGKKPKGLTAARAGGADDLKRIRGVGPKMETMMNGMGYYHFDQVAAWDSKEVEWVDENLEGFKGRVTRDKWVPQAKILAGGGDIDDEAFAQGRIVAASGGSAGTGTKPKGLSAPRKGKADDLKEIKGVGPKMETMLNGMGYYHFDQVADWKGKEVSWVDENLEGFKGRVTRDQWVPQAKILARGGRIDEDAFSRGQIVAHGDYDGDGKVEGASEGKRPATLSGPRGGKADDLKKIKGVGPKMEKMLQGMGFYHFDQVAAWSADEVAWVDANLEGFKGRVSRDEWVKQAKLLAAGKETAFSKKVGKGGVY